MIDLSTRNVLVIAGDEQEQLQALDYLHALIPCTDHISVLALSPAPSLKDLAEKHHIRLKEKAYAREDLYGEDLVISTLSDPSVNDDIHAACRTLGIRLQMTAEPGRSDFISIL